MSERQNQTPITTAMRQLHTALVAAGVDPSSIQLPGPVVAAMISEQSPAIMRDERAEVSETAWTPTERALPPDEEIVWTMGPNDLIQTLKRRGNLWFVPDGSMYIYYMPKFWKYL
jgi:hypothetical protein